jgi:hypothetical protein
MNEIVRLTGRSLFSHMANRKDWQYIVKVSYLEVIILCSMKLSQT